MVKTEKFILRYANCWEDADLLIQNLNCKKGDRILSICSGGENSLSLLCLNPQEIVVVDVNPKQLFILELISGQKAVITKAKKSVSNFKVRKSIV